MMFKRKKPSWNFKSTDPDNKTDVSEEDSNEEEADSPVTFREILDQQLPDIRMKERMSIQQSRSIQSAPSSGLVYNKPGMIKKELQSLRYMTLQEKTNYAREPRKRVKKASVFVLGKPRVVNKNIVWPRVKEQTFLPRTLGSETRIVKQMLQGGLSSKGKLLDLLPQPQMSQCDSVEILQSSITTLNKHEVSFTSNPALLERKLAQLQLTKERANKMPKKQSDHNNAISRSLGYQSFINTDGLKKVSTLPKLVVGFKEDPELTHVYDEETAENIRDTSPYVSPHEDPLARLAKTVRAPKRHRPKPRRSLDFIVTNAKSTADDVNSTKHSESEACESPQSTEHSKGLEKAEHSIQSSGNTELKDSGISEESNSNKDELNSQKVENKSSFAKSGGKTFKDGTSAKGISSPSSLHTKSLHSYKAKNLLKAELSSTEQCSRPSSEMESYIQWPKQDISPEKMMFKPTDYSLFQHAKYSARASGDPKDHTDRRTSFPMYDDRTKTRFLKVNVGRPGSVTKRV